MIMYAVDNHCLKEKAAAVVIIKVYNISLLILKIFFPFRSLSAPGNTLPGGLSTDEERIRKSIFPTFYCWGAGCRNSISVYDARRSQDRRSMTIKYKLKTR